MPLIDVTYDASVSERALRQLGEMLPAIVSEAVNCPEDPWIGPPTVGDFEIRFRPKGPLDLGDLNCVIEVRTKLFSTREHDKHRRADLLRDRLGAILDPAVIGVWLILSEGAWAQSTL